jgi:hypothetical protein
VTKTFIRIDPSPGPDSIRLFTIGSGDDELATLQKAVGGYIEIVWQRFNLGDGEQLEVIVNEEGRINGMGPNQLALAAGIDLYGPVVLTGGVGGEGDTLGIPEATLSYVREQWPHLSEGLDNLPNPDDGGEVIQQ